jgi:hypothetical protein
MVTQIGNGAAATERYASRSSAPALELPLSLMDPVFTIPYPEYAVASQLSHHLPNSQGYTIFVPASRQQKGVDLLVTYRSNRVIRAMSIQIKSSRTYSQKTPGVRTRKPFRYQTWYNNFEAPPEADFIFLIALYPNDERDRSRALETWWSQVVLVFTHEEMVGFLASVKTLTGTRDKMFGFGFDTPKCIRQTRGDQHQRYEDFTDHLLSRRVHELKQFLGEEASPVSRLPEEVKIRPQRV